MMTKNVTVWVLVCGLVAATAQTAGSAGFTDPKCASAKQKAAAKKEAAKLGCYAKAAGKGSFCSVTTSQKCKATADCPSGEDCTPTTPVDPACLTKAEGAFSAAFAKADSKGVCTGTASTTEASVDGCITKIVEDTPIPPASDGKCPSAKQKAAAKAAAAELGCYAKATGKGGFCSVTTKQKCEKDSDCPTGETCNQTAVDQACLDKATAALDAAFIKAEAKGACPGTAAGVGADVDAQCVFPIKSGLPGLPPGCGNHVTEPQLGETCDDGNTVNGDSCPASCHVDSCTPTATPLATSVTYAGPAGVTIEGLSIFVDYPEAKVGVPVFSNVIGNSNTPEDLGYGFNDQALRTSGALSKPFVHANFKTCQGAPATVASDFTCTVTDASDDQGQPVPANQVTCTVTIP